MPTLPEVMVTLLLPFDPLFDPRTWRKAQLLTVGAILSPGKRTVSSALNIPGVGQRGDFATFHHVLNRARWSPLHLSRALLFLLLRQLCPPAEPLVFGIDETFSGLTKPWNGAGGERLLPKLDFTHFKRHKRGNLQYDGTEWRGVSVHRSWRSIVKNPPTPTTSGYAQR